MFSSTLYKSSPIPLQDALLSGRGWLRRRLREGRQFGALLDEALATQWLPAQALARYQQQELARVLAHASRSVPYYRARGGAPPAPDDTLAALGRWPLLTKADVRAAGDDMRSAAHRWPVFRGSTSGTTGTPLVLLQDLRAITRENVFLARQLHWAGWTPGSRRAWIRGDMVTPVEQREPPFWRTNHGEGMLMLSSYHLSESNASAYLDALAGFGPAVIQAYPSSIGFLAAWLDSHGRDYAGAPLKGIVTSSEAIGDAQLACIERRFGCRVFDWYGQFERVAAVGTCEHGRRHLIADYSYVELVPTTEGRHEIVGTGFNNLAMPLVRYRTGDEVELPPADAPTCPCGRAFPVVSRVVGTRNEDSLELPGQRVVRRLGHIFNNLPRVIESQIRQCRDGSIRILVVSAGDFPTEQRHRLLRQARERLGHEVAIAIERVDEIPRGRNGKRMFIVRE
ncbi:MAG TPA: phenylacetate--CoA ligase family protein [Burkholderiaceae bacterium]